MITYLTYTNGGVYLYLMLSVNITMTVIIDMEMNLSFVDYNQTVSSS